MKNPVSASLGRIDAIARNTFIEAYRNRAFLGLGMAAVGMVVSSMALSQLAVTDQAGRVLVDFGLFSISLLEVIIAIVMGVILIYKEVDRKTFY
ncbi:MAG: ABC transporter permease, partial [Deltaproteobacteria bacterium]|nr:ABC transporter permease [Deltaproteobacteria bacterium]